MKEQKQVELTEKQFNSEYNDEPVYYCKNCLSLRIESFVNSEDLLCATCGRTDIETTDVFTWREMWKNKYGKYPEY